MKKLITVGLMAVLAAGIAHAQNDVVIVDQANNDGSQVEVSAELGLFSSYVWRGQVLNNDFVFQPQATIEQYGVSLNFWGNYDLAGSNTAGGSTAFSEIDLSLAYRIPLNINEVSFDVGVINYNFPENNGSVLAESTTELFLAATILSFADYVIPSCTIYGDVDAASGIYVEFDIVAPYQVSDYFAVEGGFRTGWGNTSYNSHYWDANADAGWNDYNFYGNAAYQILDNLTVAVNLTYSMTEGGSIKQGAKNNYDSAEKVWGGVNLAYDF